MARKLCPSFALYAFYISCGIYFILVKSRNLCYYDNTLGNGYGETV